MQADKMDNSSLRNVKLVRYDAPPCSLRVSLPLCQNVQAIPGHLDGWVSTSVEQP
jgi:hypothetical protein